MRPLELQSPIPGIPKDIGLKVAAFADAGSLWDYRGLSPTQLAAQFNGQTISLSDNSMQIRSSVGVGLLWDSPFGPLRIDYAYAIRMNPGARTGSRLLPIACDFEAPVHPVQRWNALLIPTMPAVHSSPILHVR